MPDNAVGMMVERRKWECGRCCERYERYERCVSCTMLTVVYLRKA